MNEIGFIGQAPIVEISNHRPSERELYRLLWQKEEYRQISPGEQHVLDFLAQAKPKRGAEVTDLGCGTGRAGNFLASVGMKVNLIDFTDNCLDAAVLFTMHDSDTMKFIQADLSKRLPVVSEYGFCADVLEHIPPEQLDEVLNNCLLACKHVYFHIATTEDVCGKLVGHKLHLSLHPYEWWLEKFRERECVVHWSSKDQSSCSFYVSAWVEGATVVEHGKVNSTDETIRENVKVNIASGWQQVVPHPTNDVECMIVGGGWSLVEFEEEIRQKRSEGVKLIAINGAYNWCLERGIEPSALIMVDAREFNNRFTRTVTETCKYFIASQCHPSVFEGLPKDRTYIWHTGADLIGDLLDEQYGKGGWYWTPGGSTALLRAIPLFRMLGFRRFHLYGCDSCLAEDKRHHAYEQKENDSEVIIPVIAQPSGRTFYGHTWMISQAQEFLDLVSFLGDEIDLNTHGDGLLNHLIREGERLSDNETINKILQAEE